ncbi:hypothetical protein KQ944_18155 [Bacillus subtilis]|uniref:hypothetical protein n=1 Tax=Pseudochrobactrum asaccharolyticum TaxID=354351 RepID=UPI001F36EADB|nr:hypothetical protein [Pseudochrobactrum asaccharolyticum]MCF7646921.1 hypothetical protein [Pseudochrobactrum asaccharolyticum]MCF7673563.1 hypothetical protein [Bacillus subtilis]
MTEYYTKLTFNEKDTALYGRLDVAARDLYETIDYGNFIMKKGWKATPWSRGKVYLQQSAFVTSMLVSYGRAFSHSAGWGRIPAEFLSLYDQEETLLHQKVISQRNQLYAHSDSIYYPVIPIRSEFSTDVTRYHLKEVPYADIKKLQTMCWKIINRCKEEQNDIKLRY